jgi:hypothetical protein
VVRRATAAQPAVGHLVGAHLVVAVAHLAGEVAAVVVHPAGEAVEVVLVLVVEHPAGEETVAAQLTAEAGRKLPMAVVMALQLHTVVQPRMVALLPTAERQHTAETTETAPHMVVSTLVVAHLVGEARLETHRSRVVCLLLHQVHTTLRHQVPMPLPRLGATAHTLHLRLAVRPWMLLHPAITLRQPQEPLLHPLQVAGMLRRRPRAVIQATIRELAV